MLCVQVHSSIDWLHGMMQRRYAESIDRQAGMGRQGSKKGVVLRPSTENICVHSFAAVRTIHIIFADRRTRLPIEDPSGESMCRYTT